MLIKDLINFLDKEIAPKIFNFKLNSTGLQYNSFINKNKVIKKILITFDLNIRNIHFAIKNKISFIISQNGLIKHNISQFNPLIIKKLSLLSKYPISIYVLNSSFIIAENGIIDTLIDKLYLKLDGLFKIKIDSKRYIPIGRYCNPINNYSNKKNFFLEDLIKKIKNNLEINDIFYKGDLKKKINKICIILNKKLKEDFYIKMIKNQCNCCISDKLDYNDLTIAEDLGISLIYIPFDLCYIPGLRKLYNYLSLEFPNDEFYFYNSIDNMKLYK
ncbi:MAG: Nif3-like dinuclear metal center hexameric protein [Promethearchaeia archaeon]